MPRRPEITLEELLTECRALYAREGIAGLSAPSLEKYGLYYPLYYRGVTQKKLIQQLDLVEELRTYNAQRPITRGGKTAIRWSWDQVLQRVAKVISAEGSLPPAEWFRKNGHSSLVQSVYGMNRSWEDVRTAFNRFDSGSFVESRAGIRWRSHPEASLSNFLYARGIAHKRGERYPAEYAESHSFRYAYFDLHFCNLAGNWIDVEIWGDKPHGHNQEGYRKKRLAKEQFNAANLNFLGLHFSDCYSEEKLTAVLAPHIGVIAPFKFDRRTDDQIHSTHWSNADELIEFCKVLAASMPDGKFPTEEWLRKRGKWIHRDGPPYNTASGYIKTWLGGVRTLRRLLDQAEVSSNQWTAEKARSAYKAFYERHGIAPSQARQQHRRKVGTISAELAREAATLESALRKYVGSASQFNRDLGIIVDRTRKWTKESIARGFEQSISEHGGTPSQLLHDHCAGKLRLTPEYFQYLRQLQDAATRVWGSAAAVMAKLNLLRPKRSRLPRSPRKN